MKSKKERNRIKAKAAARVPFDLFFKNGGHEFALF